MKKNFTLIKFIVSSVLSISTLIVSLVAFGSCAKTEHRFIHSEETVSKVEIVEYDNYSLRENAIVLAEITDCEAFLTDLKKITHKRALRDPAGISQRTIAFKITYENGDYELFDHRRYAEVFNGLYDGSGMTGYFDSEQFYELMASYLADTENAKFNLLHTDIPVSSVDIVKTYNENSTYYETVIATVDDCEEFILNLSEVNYTYLNDLSQNSKWQYTDKDIAVKITYENGDYEVFSHNHREEYRAESDVNHPNVYIGIFDSEKFYSLLSEYTGN